ncbi:hypothetical protein [Anaeroselena agilis]|uniref:Tetratricopeptide repeat protein n=1 Tax=Anaeroselena agilis TaxID=3063788 RepID=A0ABU3NTI5_9FIRM|nr:tetratricopeptide repeat protein [Selenomonadales bacterium 4137-cl]
MINTDKKIMVSARVNAEAVSFLKNMEVPLSDVIEAGIMCFLLLDDFDKVKFLIQNNEEVALKKVVQSSRGANTKIWPEMVKELLGLKSVTEVKPAVRELISVAKNLEDRGEEVFFKKRIAGLDATALLQEANLLMLRSDFAGALMIYESALRLFEVEPDWPEAAKTQVMVGKCHQYLKYYSCSLHAYEEARRVFKQLDMWYELAGVLFDRGTCYQMTGRYEEAYDAFNESRLLFEGLGNSEAVFRAFSHMEACLSCVGDKKRMLELYDLLFDRIENLRKQLLPIY